VTNLHQLTSQTMSTCFTAQRS